MNIAKKLSYSQFLDLRDPEVDEFQNLTSSFLSEDASLVKYSQRSDQ